MDKLIETAPATIWLCVSDEPGDYHEPFPKDLGEVTWAVDHSPVCCSVKYVRSDVQASQLRRENERLRAVAEAVKSLANGDLDPQYGPDAAVLAALARLAELEKQ